MAVESYGHRITFVEIILWIWYYWRLIKEKNWRDTLWWKKTPQGIFIRAYMSNEVRDRWTQHSQWRHIHRAITAVLTQTWMFVSKSCQILWKLLLCLWGDTSADVLGDALIFYLSYARLERRAYILIWESLWGNAMDTQQE